MKQLSDITKITRPGMCYIPIEARKKLGMEIGEKVKFEVDEDEKSIKITKINKEG